MQYTLIEQSVEIPPLGLSADLAVPAKAHGVVLFAHGSGSSRHSPRNRFTAGELQNAGFGTLLLDLLTEAEESVDVHTRHLRFDIGLLAGRLIEVTDWLQREPTTRGLWTGYFGASTGAAAALVAAAARPLTVRAVASRGGRPDLASAVLPQVEAPTLLIVGGDDTDVLQLNRDAFDKMRCEKQLAIVPGATHLFEESGAMEQVSDLALNWFQQHLKPWAKEANR